MIPVTKTTLSTEQILAKQFAEHLIPICINKNLVGKAVGFSRTSISFALELLIKTFFAPDKLSKASENLRASAADLKKFVVVRDENLECIAKELLHSAGEKAELLAKEALIQHLFQQKLYSLTRNLQPSVSYLQPFDYSLYSQLPFNEKIQLCRERAVVDPIRVLQECEKLWQITSFKEDVLEIVLEALTHASKLPHSVCSFVSRIYSYFLEWPANQTRLLSKLVKFESPDQIFDSIEILLEKRSDAVSPESLFEIFLDAYVLSEKCEGGFSADKAVSLLELFFSRLGLQACVDQALERTCVDEMSARRMFNLLFRCFSNKKTKELDPKFLESVYEKLKLSNPPFTSCYTYFELYSVRRTMRLHSELDSLKIDKEIEGACFKNILNHFYKFKKICGKHFAHAIKEYIEKYEDSCSKPEISKMYCFLAAYGRQARGGDAFWKKFVSELETMDAEGELKTLLNLCLFDPVFCRQRIAEDLKNKKCDPHALFMFYSRHLFPYGRVKTEAISEVFAEEAGVANLLKWALDEFWGFHLNKFEESFQHEILEMLVKYLDKPAVAPDSAKSMTSQIIARAHSTQISKKSFVFLFILYSAMDAKLSQGEGDVDTIERERGVLLLCQAASAYEKYGRELSGYHLVERVFEYVFKYHETMNPSTFYGLFKFIVRHIHELNIEDSALKERLHYLWRKKIEKFGCTVSDLENAFRLSSISPEITSMLMEPMSVADTPSDKTYWNDLSENNFIEKIFEHTLFHCETMKTDVFCAALNFMTKHVESLNIEDSVLRERLHFLWKKKLEKVGCEVSDIEVAFNLSNVSSETTLMLIESGAAGNTPNPEIKNLIQDALNICYIFEGDAVVNRIHALIKRYDLDLSRIRGLGMGLPEPKSEDNHQEGKLTEDALIDQGEDTVLQKPVPVRAINAAALESNYNAF